MSSILTKIFLKNIEMLEFLTYNIIEVMNMRLKELRKQKKITQEKQREIENRIKQEEDEFGVSKSMIEQVQRENEQKQKKGFYKSR